MLGTHGRLGLASTLLVACLVPAAAPPVRAQEPPAAPRKLPTTAVRSLETGKDVTLPAALAGKPSLILLAEGPWPEGNAAGQTAADIRHDYATWFTYVAVASGEVSAEATEAIEKSAPAALDRLYHDREGSLRAALGFERLPVLILLDAEGAIRAVTPPEDAGTALAAAARELWNTAGPQRWRNAGVEDFRLPQVGGGTLVSFLDVAGQDGTMVAFLNSRCMACAHELEVLDAARSEWGGRISFVAIFIDPAPDARIRGFLAAAGATPDFVLRDTEFRFAGRYAIRSAPALLVIDPAGAIVLSRTGYRDGERDELLASLLRAFQEAAPVKDTLTPVGESRRLNAEAISLLREGKAESALLLQQRVRSMLPDYPSVHLRIAEAALAGGRRYQALQSLLRYLEASPETYDAAAVRALITGLSDPPEAAPARAEPAPGAPSGGPPLDTPAPGE